MLTPAEHEQRQRALTTANEIRIRRAKLKRDLHNNRASFADLLADPPDWLMSAKVHDMLLHVRRIGPRTAATAFSRAEIRTTATFQSIRAPQRTRLLNELSRLAGARPL